VKVSELVPTKPVLVIAPHLDDAVLSCAHLLYKNPSSMVVTALAGAPQVDHVGYNSKTTGQSYAPDAVEVRRDEDRVALDYLAAAPIWLYLLDADYAKHRPPGDYRDVIRDEIARVLYETSPQSVFAPLGLMHPDHVAVSDASLQLAANSPLTWYLYMDLPYGHYGRRALTRRIAVVGQRFRLVEFDSYEGDPDIKLRAVALYSSQYDTTRTNFREVFDVAMSGAERYWRLEAAR
jgi:LmbE family N-acetylglucosaminyl deacetylase